jgi:hypothetical protein
LTPERSEVETYDVGGMVKLTHALFGLSSVSLPALFLFLRNKAASVCPKPELCPPCPSVHTHPLETQLGGHLL